jgi:hypothetical protein
MTLQAISDWDDHIEAGRKYLKTASNGLSRSNIFNNELIFQLAAMGIEKIILGLCQYHHQMPCDHTLSGLVTELAGVCPMDPALVERIKRIERIDDMCSLTPEKRIPPGDEVVQEMLGVGEAIDRFACQTVP